MLSVLIYIYFYQCFENLKLQHSGTPSRPTGAAAVRAGAVYAAAVSSQSEVPDGPLEDPVGLINTNKSDSQSCRRELWRASEAGNWTATEVCQRGPCWEGLRGISEAALKVLKVSKCRLPWTCLPGPRKAALQSLT